MTFYIEYSVPAEGEQGARIPLTEQNPVGAVPVAEPGIPVVRTSELPARSAVTGTDADGAKAAAEEILAHSKTKEARLFEDEEGRLESGSGKLISVFRDGEGWSDH